MAGSGSGQGEQEGGCCKNHLQKRMEAEWDEQQRWERQVDAGCLKGGAEECNMGRR